MVVETKKFEPYVGPRPFGRSEEDRARFFGRDRETAEIVSLILSHQVLVVYAQSGAGKTSLFEAQVAPALETKGFQVLPLARVRAGMPDEVKAESIGNLYVFAALLSVAAGEDPRPSAESLAALSLHDYLSARVEEPAVPRCIVFDQFEELFDNESVFALRPDSWQEEQKAFFRQVSEAVKNDSLLRAVFLIRKEHLAELDRFAPLLPESLRIRFHLEPLGEEGALSAVTLPVQGTGRSYQDGAPEELVGKLLLMRVDVGGGKVKDVPGRFVEPLHLQLVCQSLWKELGPDDTVITTDQVRKLGDVDVVLGAFYGDAVKAASASAHLSEKRLRKQIEADFITPAGTRGIVFVPASPDGAPFNRAVGELERQHLVRAERRAGADWYELTHDRLIEPIRASNERYRAETAKKTQRKWLSTGLAVATIVVGVWAGLHFTSSNTEDQSLAAQVKSLSSQVEQSFQLEQKSVLPARTGSGTEPLSSATFSPDGQLVLTADAGGRALVWLWASRSRLKVLPANGRALSSAAFSPDGNLVLTAGADGVARIWNWRHRKVVTALGAANSAPLSRAAFNRDGGLVVTAGPKGKTRIWDWRGKQLVFQSTQRGKVESAALSRVGTFVVTAGSDGKARIWDWAKGTFRGELGAAKSAPLSSAAFSPDARFVVTAGADGTARVWDWRKKTVENQLTESGRMASAVFSQPGGAFVLTAGADRTARIWEWRSDKKPVELKQESALTDAAFSPVVSALVVTAGRNGLARIYGPAQASS
jgi:WD domain, G-beta repeat